MINEVVAVVGCGNAKLDEPAEARELYTSNYFGLKREYGEHFADRLVVLSAEHDLIRGWETIEPYDTTADDRDRDVWVDEVCWSLRSPFVLLDYADEILLLAGSEYKSVFFDALERERQSLGDESIVETTEIIDVFGESGAKGIGEQMGYLREAVDGDLRQPDGDRDQQTGLDRFAGRTKVAATDGGQAANAGNSD